LLAAMMTALGPQCALWNSACRTIGRADGDRPLRSK
jgi:hypothetical protein